MRALVFVALALVLAAPAAAATRVTAKLTTTSRTPTAGEPWRYTVTVRSGGKPIAARLRLQILLGQTVVGCWKGGALAQCTDGSLGEWIGFRGKRTGIIRWPAESAGVKLAFQAVVRAGGRILRLRVPVTVRPAP